MSQHLGAVHVEFSDDDLVLLFQQGHLEALDLLVERYRRFTRAKARSYFLVGADHDDIEQEGLIGLFKAVRDYRPDRQSSFRAFAELCVTRQIITAIKAATRRKHQPLNHYVSLSGARAGDGAEDRSVDDLLDDHQVCDPADEVVSAERMTDITRCLAETLSRLEVAVLDLYVEGRSYQEIGVLLGRHAKSVDNALQRIKRKVDAHLRAFDDDDDDDDDAAAGYGCGPEDGYGCGQGGGGSGADACGARARPAASAAVA